MLKGFLKNKNINLLNLHAGLVKFSEKIIQIFGVIYALIITQFLMKIELLILVQILLYGKQTQTTVVH